MSKDLVEGGDPFENRRKLGTASLIPQESLDRNGYEYGDFWLGRTLSGRPFGWREDLNLLTCAGPRSGKGVGIIVPNLLDFPGSAVVVDPKGELADLTADYRRRVLGHRVIVLDPAGAAKNIPDDLRGTYNPLDALDINDPYVATAAQTIASGLVVPKPDAKDPIWDATSIDFIQGVLLYMLVHYTPDRFNLVKLLETVTLGDLGLYEGWLDAKREDDPDFSPPRGVAFELLLQRMADTEEFPLNIRGAAEKLEDMGENFKGSVLGTVRTHLDFLKSQELWSALMPTDDPARTFKLADLRNQDQPLTIYLCLPVDMMQRQGRWLRLIITQIIQYVERTQAVFDKDRDLPILMLIDEFAQLGPIPSITNTLTYAPGSGLRMWLIIQTLVQLQENYPKSWETIVGACGIKQFFGIGELTTAKYLSEMMGEGEILIPTVSLTESETDTEGTSESETLGENASMTVGSTSSDTTGTSYSRGTNESTGTSTGTNWGTGSSEGVNRGESWTGPQHNSSKQPGAPVNYSHGSSAGTSQNRGGSMGRSSSVGSSESFSSSSSHTEGTSQSETVGTSRSATRGRSLSAAKGKNYGLSYTPQVRRLYKPDELQTAFTKENLLQLVHIRDQGPMLLFRTPYYADPDFQEQIAEFEADKVQALLPAPVDDAIQLPNSIDALTPDSEALAIRASANEGTENDG
jgi:type IV secretion system protein VirD4